MDFEAVKLDLNKVYDRFYSKQFRDLSLSNQHWESYHE